MKQGFSKISKLFLTLMMCFSLIAIANAESAPSKLTMTYYTQSSTPMSFPANFHVKKTTGGKYAYCTYYSKNPPVKSVSYSRGSKITDKGINYILNQSYNAKNDNDFFIYQTALWTYMVDKGLMKGAYYDLTVFKSRVNSSTSSTAKKIKTLVSNAKKASANDTTAPTITVDTSKASFTLKDGNYVSSGIAVKSSVSTYKVALTSAPEGSTATVNGNEVIITVPASKITTLNTTIQFNVSNSKNIYTSYYYQPSNSSYQIMATTYKNTKTANATGSLTIKTTASIEINKTDESGVALKGAGMQVINSQGTVVDSWTSDGQKHVVNGLTEGAYTIKEVSAPAGYKLSTTEIKFTVGSDGKVRDSGNNITNFIAFKNEKTSVTISKQDITSKTELPGATLVIKNKDGQEVVKWTSSTKQYIIKGLAAGTYTLTETIAPDGYSLSTETITFTIDNYGNLYNGTGTKVDKIVMYNSKITTKDVIISKRDITSNEELPGAKLKLSDANGKEIYSWTSENTPHIFRNLSAGTYTLTETIAPDGYKLSTETITFKVDNEGKIYDQDGKALDKVIMYNQKETTTGGVSVSKQDITNGKELPGATLVIKDYNGNEIDTWISTDTPHVINNLKPGIYTLTETQQPTGYILSTETITFTVKEDGSITKVVMYNSPDSKDLPSGNGGEDIPVESTGSFKNVTTYVIGIAITLIGALMIYKTSKKNKITN